MLEKKIMKKNMTYAILAQSIALILNIIISLYIPKLLGVEQFGYWQLFLFYINYLGFMHFGINDGLYLRLGGKKENDLEKSIISAQFWVLFAVQCIIAIIIIAASYCFIQNNSRKFVWVAVALYLPLINSNGFIGYIFQAINQTNIYSKAVIIDKCVILISILILTIFNCDQFELFIVFYVVARAISLIYQLYIGRKIIFYKPSSINNTLKELFINIKVGILLMIANIMSSLILGVGRKFVDFKWGIEAFSKFSFSISLSNFFLLFVSQVSMVIFPALRRCTDKSLKKIYLNGRILLGITLIGGLLLYMPVNFLIGIWLPQYKDSLMYLVLLLPIFVYDGKMQILNNTYFKVLRKEKLMMIINLISLIICFVLSLIGTMVINSIYFIIISMVISIAVRSIIADIILSKDMEIEILSNLLFENLLIIIFVICTWFFGTFNGFIIYLALYIVLLLLNRRQIINSIKELRSLYS